MSRTVFAVTAALRSRLASRPVGPARRLLCLGAPPRTTLGGARSKQLLSLATSLSDLPCGWLDLVEARCVLATWPALVAAHRARDTGPLEFTEDDYLRFTAWLEDTLAPMHVRVSGGARPRWRSARELTSVAE